MDPEQTQPDSTTAEAPDSHLCASCNYALIDRSESPHSVLCPACREKMIRHPIPKIFILFAIVIVILVVVAFYRFPTVLENYRLFHNALAQSHNGEVSDALANLNIVMEKYPDSEPIAIRMADISMEKGYYEYAGYVIDTYLSGRKMDDDIVTRINGYIDRINKYYQTYDDVTNFESKLDPSLTPEAAAKQCYDYMLGLMNDPKQDRALLYYYLSTVCTDMDDSKGFLENSLKEDAAFLESKNQLANIVRRQGDVQAAEHYYNDVLQVDKSNCGALRGLAVLRLLEGKPEEGLDLIYQAFTIDPNGLYVWETYIVALHENKKDSDADAQTREYLAKGYVLEEDTKNYLDGKLSLQEYYIGG